MKNKKDLLEQVRLYYHEFDLSIFPVKLTAKNKNKANKKPLTKWKRLQKEKPTEAEINMWFNELDEANGVGIVTGKINNLFVLDCDSEKGWQWIQDQGYDSGSPVVATGSGGHHIYFSYPENEDITIGARIGGELEGLSLDFRCDGGYAVAPSSEYPTENETDKYEWIKSFDPTSLKPPPDRIIKAIEEDSTSSKNGKKNLGEILKGVQEGKRNESAAAVAGSLLGKGLDEELAWSTLKTWNQDRNDPPLKEKELQDVFENIAEREKEKQEKSESDFAWFGESMKEEDPTFLWEPYIPKKELTILAGDRGVGKSIFVLKLASIITSNYSIEQNFYHESEEMKVGKMERQPSSTVLYVTRENRQPIMNGFLKKITKKVPSANRNKIGTAQFVENKSGKPLNIVKNLDKLESLMKRANNPKLIILDPIQEFLGTDFDMDQANQVRPALTQLGKLAVNHSTSILMIAHLRKSGARHNILDAIMGSGEFTGVVRSALYMKENEKDESLKFIAHPKHNLSKRGQTTVIQTGDDGLIHWSGFSNQRPKDFLRGSSKKQKASKTRETKDIIKTFVLSGGPVKAKQMEDDVLSALDIGKSTYKKARKELKGDGVIEKHKEKHWWWYLTKHKPINWKEVKDD